MVYSYQIIKFQTISFVQGTNWSQSVGDKGILYKSLKNPFSKLIVQSHNSSKKLYHVPKDRTVIVTNDIVHFLELDKKVFGKITTKEIIGANPPMIPDMKNIFEKEFELLLIELKLQSKENLKNLLIQQHIAEAHINNRPGAMALAQNKIQLFIDYNKKYVQIINEKLES